MRQAIASLLFASMIVAGCAEPERPRIYRDLAQRLNPLLVLMRPAARRVALLDGQPDDVIVDACRSANDALRTLGAMKLDDEYIALKNDDLTVANIARLSLGEFESCSNPHICVLFCVRDWEYLRQAVDQLVWGAAEHDIGIVPLR